MAALGLVIFIIKQLNNKVMKKTSLFILFTLVLSIGFSQKYLKNPEVNNLTLTITPLVFDPEMDSTITYIEFFQDTTKAKYDEKIYAVVHSREKKKFPDGDIDWPVLGIGFIGDYRVDNSVSIIIKAHYYNGTTKTFTYQAKIKDLTIWHDFEWAMYSPDVEVIYDEETFGL
jgi:hypothetical protein